MVGNERAVVLSVSNAFTTTPYIAQIPIAFSLILRVNVLSDIMKLSYYQFKVLERNEWKPYKNAIIQWKKVKHCSRNLFKTCDTDSNSRLTTDEWKNCLIPVDSKTSAVRPEQLNPFLYILKAD
ncbi:unnamed protein product [Angiostrongylus costaricensis]|uniref:EF-hand domain-containing protein n=1 Tax=Angiostrongylus costaricensis TaxID=334426 RepID=A0A0R3PKA1_ANGCS|nr:unnamed protein product [Angiostrongylus costaricensis]